MSRPTRAVIDLAAIRSNFRFASSLVPNSFMLAVVKADAYGHGAVNVAKTLSGLAPAFAVATIDEAIILREAGLSEPILLLEGPFREEEIEIGANSDYWFMVHNERQLSWIRRSRTSKKLKIWLKSDTGMHRLGFQADEFREAYRELRALDFVHNEVVLTSHLQSADARDCADTAAQLDRFFAVVDGLEGPVSIANSPGILAHERAWADWNRPGIMLYGVTPFGEMHSRIESLRPAMSLESEVIAVRDVGEGESVGYGGVWRASRPSRIATVAIGYGDGYPRNARNGTPVCVNGAVAPLAGRVSMDMITVDVTDVPNVEIGAPVELWGLNINITEIGLSTDASPYELLTRISPRVPRIYRQ